MCYNKLNLKWQGKLLYYADLSGPTPAKADTYGSQELWYLISFITLLYPQ